MSHRAYFWRNGHIRFSHTAQRARTHTRTPEQSKQQQRVFFMCFALEKSSKCEKQVRADPFWIKCGVCARALSHSRSLKTESNHSNKMEYLNRQLAKNCIRPTTTAPSNQKIKRENSKGRNMRVAKKKSFNGRETPERRSNNKKKKKKTEPSPSTESREKRAE